MGKGSSSAHTAVEQPDTLKNKQQLNVLDLISEGPILGPVNTTHLLNSIRLAGTSVQQEDGTTNITGVSMAMNYGTKDQSYLDGFAASESETSVGVDVKKNVPAIRTINRHVDRLRLTLGGTALYTYEENGDRNGASVALSIQVMVNGSWTEKGRMDLVNEKSNSEYLIPVEINDLPAAPFDVRVVRETADSTKEQLQNGTFWRTYTEINDTKQTFPYCACVGLKIDSENFGSSPARNYLMYGLIIQVPSNYDAFNRTYSGFWNREFKPSWTDNPAWVYLDLLTNERYGLGDKITIDMVDIDMLYQVAKYCDELVDDGYGGKEPRFTFNAWMTEQRNAYDVLTDLCSVFNAMPIWLGTVNSVSIDMPGDIVAQYTKANTVGDFTYSSTELSDRHSVIEVTYSNPNNNYETEIEYVQDDELFLRYGYRLKKVTAYACTSRGQARRLGLYILESEKQQVHAVTFKTGIAGLRNIPGDIIEVSDPDWAGAILGGRIAGLAGDGKLVTLDRPIDIVAGEQVYLGFIENKQFKKTKIESASSDGYTVSIAAPSPSIVVDSVFSITRVDIQPRTFRCTDITFDNSKMEFTVSAILHAARKYSDIDNNTYFGPGFNSGTLYNRQLPSVQNLTVGYNEDSTTSNIIARWECPTAGTNVRYRVAIRRGDKAYYSGDQDDKVLNININDIGEYTISVRCVSMADNRLGNNSEVSFSINVPKVLQSISVTAGTFNMSLRPIQGSVTNLGDQFQWYFGASEAEVIAETHYLGRAYVMNKSDLKPNTEYWFGCRVINPIGRSAMKTVLTKTILNSDDYLAVIAPNIPNVDYIKEMNKSIDGLSNLASLRVSDTNGTNPRISGVYVNSGNAAIDKASVVDIVADYFAISSPDLLQRWVYFNTSKKMLTILGDIQAKSGTFDNCTINDTCVIKGKLSVKNLEGNLVDGNCYSWVAANTFAGRTLRYAGNPDIPMRIYGRVIAVSSGALYNGVYFNGDESDFIAPVFLSRTTDTVTGGGTVTTNVYEFNFSRDVGEGVALDIGVKSGSSENTRFMVQIFATPNTSKFSISG